MRLSLRLATNCSHETIRSMFFNNKKSDAEAIGTMTTRSLVRYWGMFFVMLFIFLGIVKALQITAPALVLIFVAFFLALALNAPVHWVALHLPGKKRGNRSLATTVSVIFILALLIGFLASIVPPFVRQISSLVQTAPTLINDLHDNNSDIGRLVQRYNLEPQIESFSDDLGHRLKNASGAAVSVVSSIGSSTFALLTILVLTFMMLIEGPRWAHLFREMIPEDRRDHASELAMAMYKVIKGYVNGQVLLAAIAAFLILPVLVILGVGYPIALMVVVFICGLIPMVGHTIGAAIVTLVALFTSPLAALITLGYYILYQQVENYLIQPKIQSSSTNMSPLLVFMSVVLGVNFGGLLGGLVAIPVMGCIRILVLDQLTRRNIIKSSRVKRTVAAAESKAQTAHKEAAVVKTDQAKKK